MGNGLLTSDGSFWLRQRRIAQGAFQRRQIAAFAGPIRECVADTAYTRRRVLRVFRESLRLYPPTWGFGRTAIHEDEIGGYSIPAGALLLISPWVTPRSPRFWDRPPVFDPDRFLPAASAARPKFAYFPFGSGPRICIGAGLAALEAPLIVASLLQRFDFELPAGTTLECSPRISLRPRGIVPMRLRALRP